VASWPPLRILSLATVHYLTSSTGGEITVGWLGTGHPTNRC